jgi:gas vesicle protein
VDAVCNVLGAVLGAAAAVRYAPRCSRKERSRSCGGALLQGGAIDLGSR